MRFGSACSVLKKTWKNFKAAGHGGTGWRGDLAYRINKIQDAMGIPLTEFEEYPYVYGEEEAASQEEWELRKVGGARLG